MTELDNLRAGVRESLSPELSEIRDPELREKVVEAWALALSQTEFQRIDDIRASAGPEWPPIRNGTQAHHLRGVARIAGAMADAIEQVVGPIGVNRDIAIAGGLCHDLGKAWEFSPRNRARWQANPSAVGYPSIRHPAYGVHVALTVGLPEAVAHIAGAHSMEGEYVTRSLENTLVHFADYAFWHVLERADLLEGEVARELLDAARPGKR